MPRYAPNKTAREIEETVCKLYSVGMSMDLISQIKDIPVTKSTVERIIKRAGLSRTRSEAIKLRWALKKSIT